MVMIIRKSLSINETFKLMDNREIRGLINKFKIVVSVAESGISVAGPDEVGTQEVYNKVYSFVEEVK